MLLLYNADGRILLARRPPAGIWGGLWSLPECDPDTDIAGWCRKRLGLEVVDAAPGHELKHAFSHFDLEITPVTARVQRIGALMEKHDTVWYNVDRPDRRGIAAPVKLMLQQLRTKA
jgi:A/G-specific adenine glycosylase